jgi:hypothetical protein
MKYFSSPTIKPQINHLHAVSMFIIPWHIMQLAENILSLPCSRVNLFVQPCNTRLSMLYCQYYYKLRLLPITDSWNVKASTREPVLPASMITAYECFCNPNVKATLSKAFVACLYGLHGSTSKYEPINNIAMIILYLIYNNTEPTELTAENIKINAFYKI